MFPRPARLFLTSCILGAILFGLNGCSHSAKQMNLPTNDARTAQLHADAAAGRLAALRWPKFPDYQHAVTEFYSRRKWDPAWIDGRKPTRQALTLIRLFQASSEKGLNPIDYDAWRWPMWVYGLQHASDPELADFDTAMTVATMRYLSDLHSGRINPSRFSYGIVIHSLRPQLPAFLEEHVVSAADMASAVQSIEPDSAQYRATLNALHTYQDLARKTANDKLLDVPTRPLPAGSPYAEAAALAARLALLGDLPADAAAEPADGARYTREIAAGVAAFQGRYGLPATGSLTPKTVVLLNVSLSQRAQQLADTLERLRWLPTAYQSAPLVVNIPEFTLRAYDPDHKPAFTMRVVVGDSDDEDHWTPLLAQQMRYLVFRPYWVVTPTIIKSDLVPKVQADKGYLDAHNFEVITRAGKPVPDWTVDGLEHGRYMVREKPGPQNSLGLIKFIFPNRLNIYMHSTPAVWLFSRPKRDFSHGCIRLQDPTQLAEWVLADIPKWTPDAIADAMNTGRDSTIVPLHARVPVVITYETARVGEDGKVHFFRDLYGYDQRLEQELSAGDPYSSKPLPKKLNTGDTA